MQASTTRCLHGARRAGGRGERVRDRSNELTDTGDGQVREYGPVCELEMVECSVLRRIRRGSPALNRSRDATVADTAGTRVLDQVSVVGHGADYGRLGDGAGHRPRLRFGLPLCRGYLCPQRGDYLRGSLGYDHGGSRADMESLRLAPARTEVHCGAPSCELWLTPGR